LKHRTLWVALGLRPAYPQHSAEEAACLAKWAQGRKRLVEIGVAEGASALILRQNMHPRGDLWLVDPFHLSHNPLFNTGLVAVRRTLGRCRRGRVHIVRAWSRDAVKNWHLPIDFLFIDGDHRYESVLADWEGFAPWVEPGGVILFHDAKQTQDHPVGPAQVVDRIFRGRGEPGWSIVEESGTIVAVLRKEQVVPVPDSAARGRTVAVSVIVPTWRRAEWLYRCLKTLGSQTCRPDEVIVVGRADDKPAQQAVATFRSGIQISVRWIGVSRAGHIAPVRRGLEEAQSEIMAFLDDDTEPEPGWLETLLEPFSNPTVACVGGRVITPGFRGVIRKEAGRMRWYGRHIGNIGALEAPGPLEVDGVMECNWAWRRSVLRSLDFDSALDYDDASMYGLDLCLQAKKLGWRIMYHPGARVIHNVAPRDPTLDRADRVKRTRTYTRNYTYIAIKHLKGSRKIAFTAWWWLVGERGAYGLLRGLFDVAILRNGARDIWRAAQEGRREGMRLWRTHAR